MNLPSGSWFGYSFVVEEETFASTTTGEQMFLVFFITINRRTVKYLKIIKY